MQDINTPLSEPNIDGYNSQRVDISFKDISYSIQVEDTNAKKSCFPCKKQKMDKQLLNNLSGIFKAGELTAIMGASGAGKTTLLNVIACRIKPKKVSGSIYANSTAYRFKTFGDFANYVTQKDILMETLTVRETLEIAANLKLNASTQEKKQRISTIVKKFKL